MERSLRLHSTRRAYKTLGLVRRSFNKSFPASVKKSLYVTLVKSLLTYSQIRRPYLLKGIRSLECIQRCATQYVLNKFTNNYKIRLTSLKLFPLVI